MSLFSLYVNTLKSHCASSFCSIMLFPFKFLHWCFQCYCNNIFPLFPSYVIFLFTTIFLVFLQQWFLFVKFCICFYNDTFHVLATTIFHFVSYIVCVFTMTFSVFYNSDFFLSILSCLCFSFFSFHNLHLGHNEHSKYLLMNPNFPSHHAIVKVSDFLLRSWERNLKLYGRFLGIW
jgi:hypothetical protein